MIHVKFQQIEFVHDRYGKVAGDARSLSSRKAAIAFVLISFYRKLIQAVIILALYDQPLS